MKRIAILLALGVFLTVSCKKEQGKEISQVGEKAIDTLTIGSNTSILAVDTLTIGSNTFILDAYLWRDFMPISPEDGQPMIAINWLVSTDSTKIPENISMIKQYVLFGDEVWEANYENEASTPSLPEYKLERISRNGPKWGSNINVDVISQIYDSQTNKNYYIERKGVYVLRID